MSKLWQRTPKPHRLTRQLDARVSMCRALRVARGRVIRGVDRERTEFVPPEDWHEPTADHSANYRVIVQAPGRGYRHAVSARDVRDRLDALPAAMCMPLNVVQLSRMTRKKRTFPCYGMQWGSALYLYPIEESMIEHFSRPPLPAERQEVAMFGGKWKFKEGYWQLIWTAATLRDFYLNNVLMHELGHLLDERNTRYKDRERFAEWFALKYGSLGNSARPRRRGRRVVRRHGRRR